MALQPMNQSFGKFAQNHNELTQTEKKEAEVRSLVSDLVIGGCSTMLVEENCD